jgi:putative Holliday junction resolvase
MIRTLALGGQGLIDNARVGRILGLDVGDRWIGVALSDPEGILASPLTRITREGTESTIEAILQLVRQHQVRRIVAGLPYSMRGGLGQQAIKVLDFLHELRQHSEIPVETWDERLSTVAAERRMREAGIVKKRKREKIDAAAAALILQAYLDEVRTNVGTEL